MPTIIDIETSARRVALISSNKTLYMCGSNDVFVLFILFLSMEHSGMDFQEVFIQLPQQFSTMLPRYHCLVIHLLLKSNVLRDHLQVINAIRFALERTYQIQVFVQEREFVLLPMYVHVQNIILERNVKSQSHILKLVQEINHAHSILMVRELI
jgi:hypothetical protein